MNREPRTTPACRRKFASLAAVALALVVAGCEPSEPAVEPAIPAAKTPEEKLATILSLVREGVGASMAGDRRVSAVVPGGIQPQWNTTVTEQLQKPRTPNDNYRATIRIVTEGSLMVRVRPKVDDDEPTDRYGGKPRRTPNSGARELRYSEPEAGDADGLDSFDPRGDAASANKRNAVAQPPSIRTVDSRNEKVFVLVYENGNWNMLTEFEKDSSDMELYMRTFERALRLQ